MRDRRQSQKQTTPKKRKDRVTKEMMRLQCSTRLLIPKLSFKRLVREIVQKFRIDYRVQPSALETLQAAAECYLVTLFEDSYRCCLRRKRKTFQPEDMDLVLDLRGPNDPGKKNNNF